LILIAVFIILLIYIKYNISQTNTDDKVIDVIDLQEIIERGELCATLRCNSTDYYILDGNPYGFQYEMIRDFAEFLNLYLNITVVNDLHESVNLLKNKKCDIVCANITIVKNRFGSALTFTKPYAKTHQVLVQHKNNPSGLIKKKDDFEGKTIYIPSKTIFKRIIKGNTKELINKPYIVEVPYVGSEYLIDAVSEGIISYTVSNYNLARYYNSYYKNLDLSILLTPQLPLGWAVRTESKELLKTLNSWFDEYLKTKEFEYLYYRYFRRNQPVRKQGSEYFSLKKGKISCYDEVIKKYSKIVNLDWRLISALIYEESQFNHDTVSPKGAYGIMQLIPETADFLGVNEGSTSEEHIKAGVKYLKFIDKSFKGAIPDKNERIKFVIASYNLGPGHVWDAIKLSGKYKKNPKIWFNNVEYYLIAKSQYEYYTDEVVKHGYCQGKSAAEFVRKVLSRYNHYKNLFPAE